MEGRQAGNRYMSRESRDVPAPAAALAWCVARGSIPAGETRGAVSCGGCRRERGIMKKWITGVLAAAALATGASAAERPNVVIIYGDDVGYADVGVYGAKLIPTPHLDKLAGEGLVFTDAHCSASTCTPSRFSLLTGRMGFRNGARILPPGAPLIIPTNILTLPKLFKQAGYTTGVVGKWHLGLGRRGTPVDWNGDVKPGPLEVGFDHSFLLPSTNDRVPCVYLENYRVVNLDPRDPLHLGRQPNLKEGSTVYPDGRKNREAMTYYQSSHGHNHSVINGIGRIGFMAGGKAALWDDETMADEFVKQAGRFIAANREKPFFLYFASQDIHVPRAPHPRFRGKSKLSYRGDAMVQLDWSVGAVLEMLDEHGLKENTIVIFSSDNGPVYDDGYKDGTTVKPKRGEVDRGHDASGPYRGGKYEISEGGTRVPLIVRWPERIKPGTSRALVSWPHSRGFSISHSPRRRASTARTPWMRSSARTRWATPTSWRSRAARWRFARGTGRSSPARRPRRGRRARSSTTSPPTSPSRRTSPRSAPTSPEPSPTC